MQDACIDAPHDAPQHQHLRGGPGAGENAPHRTAHLRDTAELPINLQTRNDQLIYSHTSFAALNGVLQN